jgi:hypothetical protein
MACRRTPKFDSFERGKKKAGEGEANNIPLILWPNELGRRRRGDCIRREVYTI